MRENPRFGKVLRAPLAVDMQLRQTWRMSLFRRSVRFMFLLLPWVCLAPILTAQATGVGDPSVTAARMQTTRAVAPVGASNGERDAAVRRAFFWLRSTGEKSAVIQEYGSDFLELYYELVTSSEDGLLRREALDAGRQLAARYERLAAVPRDGDEAIDIISAWGLLPSFGKVSKRLEDMARAARQKFAFRDMFAIEPGGTSSDPNTLCDAVISLHFAGRSDLAEPEVVSHAIDLAVAYEYIPRTRLDEDACIDQDNLVSHVVYVLSDYGRLSLSHCRLHDEMRYMRQSLPKMMDEADVEMGAEFVDSLRILGVPDTEPLMSQAILWLLSAQNADGSFGDPGDPDIYSRYHTTWTAMNGLRRFRFEGPGPRWSTSECRQIQTKSRLRRPEQR